MQRSRPKFDNLSTEQFRLKMQPAAESIYKELWPGCTVESLRDENKNVHVLDKHFGIDKIITLPSGQWITIQEKYRQNEFLINTRFRVDERCPDFTQEYMNGQGTIYESHGEWFHLGAQLYFYGWANKAETDFENWVLLDVAKYKLLVEQSGGLHRIGQMRQNRKHGSASFVCIPVLKLKKAFVSTRKCLDKMTGEPW